MNSLRQILPLAALALFLLPSGLRAQTTGTGTTGTGTTGTGTTGTGTTGTTTTANAGIATIGGTVATTSTGPIAVWRLTFSQTGDSINYRPYQGGFYIAPIEGGSGTLILTLVTGNLKQYFTYSAFGDVFVAVKGKDKKMVLSATAASSVSTTTFYGIGTADHEISLDSSNSRNVVGKVYVASKMTGYAVSADSEQDLPFAGASTSVGVAGASILTAKLDETLTHSGNTANNSVATEATDLQAILAKAGYTDGKATANPNVN
jgi:hypothetical protein